MAFSVDRFVIETWRIIPPNDDDRFLFRRTLNDLLSRPTELERPAPFRRGRPRPAPRQGL